MEAENKEFLLRKGLVAGEILGKGSFGVVYRCTKFENDGMEVFAVKIISLKLLRLEHKDSLRRLDREISVMKRLNHPNIVRLYDTYRTNDALFLVMELVLGIDLFEMIIAKKGLHEDEARIIYVQVCKAVEYMHSRGVIHRDIKPENVIIQSSSYDKQPANARRTKKFNYSVKLIDFGLSKAISDISLNSEDNTAIGLEAGPASTARSLVGTPRYVAPEIVSESLKAKMLPNTEKPIPRAYTSAVDCYSMGVLLHVMLGACFPQFQEGKVVFKDARIAGASLEAKNLMERLLEKDPSRRLTMKDALESHPWLNVKGSIASNSTEEKTLIKASHQDSESGELSFEEFQNRIFKGVKQMDIGEEDEDVSDVSDSEVSVESISVGEPVAAKLQEMYDEETNRATMTPITGLKRQASKDSGDNPFKTQKESPLPSKNKSNSARGQTLRSENDGSKSSIEIDLPGAKSGVWGFQTFGKHDEGPNPQETIKQRDRNSTTTDITARPTALSSDADVRMTAAMEDPDRLLTLQASIADSLRAAYLEYGDDPEIAPGIVASSVGSRELLRSAENILKKLQETAKSILALLPDLQLAVEEGEFAMAASFFATIKEWIQTLKSEAQGLLRSNVAVIASVNNTILMVRKKKKTESSMWQRLPYEVAPSGESVSKLVKEINRAIYEGEKIDVGRLTTMLEKATVSPRNTEATNYSRQEDESVSHGNMAVILPSAQNQKTDDISIRNLSTALSTLQEVDKLLQQHASFWSHMEVVIQVLMQRANHVESLTNFTKNPRLRGRFMERLGEYAETWNRVLQMCERFNMKSRNITPFLYRFLQEDAGNPTETSSYDFDS